MSLAGMKDDGTPGFRGDLAAKARNPHLVEAAAAAAITPPAFAMNLRRSLIMPTPFTWASECDTVVPRPHSGRGPECWRANAAVGGRCAEETDAGSRRLRCLTCSDRFADASSRFRHLCLSGGMGDLHLPPIRDLSVESSEYRRLGHPRQPRDS
jgi:hypothetical protein